MNQTIINQYFPQVEKIGFLKCISKPWTDNRKQTQLDKYFRPVLAQRL